MKQYYIISWKEFKNRKLEIKNELVECTKEQLDEFIVKVRTSNAEKQTATLEYSYINLSKMLSEKKLTISELIRS